MAKAKTSRAWQPISRRDTRSTLQIESGELFYCHTEIDRNKPTVLCIHGLGDSSRVFLDAFSEPALRGFNLIAPDLIGYGESRLETGSESEYKFESQIACINRLITYLGINQFFLVEHSMGADIGTLMCNADHQNRIRAFVNIEGDLTQGDRFITDAAVCARRKGAGYFENWLRHDLIEILFKDRFASFSVSRGHYEESLKYCSPEAFWTNVKQIRSLNRNLPGQKYARVAALFKEISIPKLFYWGSESLSAESKKYLEVAGFKPEPRMFKDSFHWIMLDQRDEFYKSIAESLMGRALR